MSEGLTRAKVLAQHDEAREAHVSESFGHGNDTAISSDEESGSNSPAFGSFYEKLGTDLITFMGNFTSP